MKNYVGSDKMYINVNLMNNNINYNINSPENECKTVGEIYYLQNKFSYIDSECITSYIQVE